MGRYALLLGSIAFVAALFPNGMYWGMGLGGFASVVGWLAFKRRQDSGWTRLAAAAGMTLALTALVLTSGRFVLTYWAVGRLSQMLSPG